MKIKKIIAVLGSTILATTTISFVSACFLHKVDRWNLSTWTDTQKQEINKKFLRIPSHYKTWWDYKHYQFLFDLNESFFIINSVIYIGENVSGSISPIYHHYDSVWYVFKKGLILTVKGIKDGVTGSTQNYFCGELKN